MGNSNHTIIIINRGGGQQKIYSDKNQEEMADRPRLWWWTTTTVMPGCQTAGWVSYSPPENYTPAAQTPEGAMTMDTRRATRGTGPHTRKGASTYRAGPEEGHRHVHKPGPQPHGRGPQDGEGNHQPQGPQCRWRPRPLAAVEEPRGQQPARKSKNIHQDNL